MVSRDDVSVRGDQKTGSTDIDIPVCLSSRTVMFPNNWELSLIRQLLTTYESNRYNSWLASLN